MLRFKSGVLKLKKQGRNTMGPPVRTEMAFRAPSRQIITACKYTKKESRRMPSNRLNLVTRRKRTMRGRRGGEFS